MYLHNRKNISSMKTKKLKRRRQNGGARGDTIISLMKNIASISPASMFMGIRKSRLASARVTPNDQDEQVRITRQDRLDKTAIRKSNREAKAEAKKAAETEKALAAEAAAQAKQAKEIAAEQEAQAKAVAKAATAAAKAATAAAKTQARTTRSRKPNPNVEAVIARINKQGEDFKKVSAANAALVAESARIAADSARIAADSAKVAKDLKIVTEKVDKINRLLGQEQQPEMTDEETEKELAKITNELGIKGGKKSRKHRTRRRHKKSRKYY